MTANDRKHPDAAIANTPSGAVAAAVPYNEAERLKALDIYQTLDSGGDQGFDDLAELAAAVCRAPMGFVTLIDKDRQVFKACVGMQGDEMPRDMSFCIHAILSPDTVMEVQDATLDARFAKNPLVTGPPGIRFYAGAPLITPDGVALGTVCIVDHQPRVLTDGERRALKSLARQAIAQLELRRAVADLEFMGRTDGLTGVGNRRSFDHNLRELWRRHAEDREPVALLMVDLDHFKRINDEFGHPTGDAVLVQAATILRSSVRHSDVVCRYGGEEFAVLLPGADISAGLKVAEKLRANLAEGPWVGHSLTTSVGLASVQPTMDESPAVLIARADRALYEAKRTGRDRICTFEGWL